MSFMRPLEKIIEIVGSQSSVAAGLGVAPQVVNNWMRRGAVASPENCPALERLSNGAVTCEELRPDVSWVRIPDRDWPHPQGRPLVDFTDRAGS